MKYLTLVLFALFIVVSACRDRVPDSYIEHKVLLKNNLGELSIKLPPEFDTAYSWTNYSDARCSDYEMFRFANKKYSLLQETGFIYPVIPDSLYQVTITQLMYLDCESTVKINKEALERIIHNDTLVYPGTEIFLSDLKTIQNREFILIGSKFAANTTLKLFTVISGHGLMLEFVYQGKNNFNFVERMNKSINSIKIDTLQMKR